MRGPVPLRAASAAVLALALAGPAAADRPLSAIDWLSQSIAAPTPPGAAPSLPGAPVAAVRAVPLDALARDGAGAVSAEAAGLPRGFWGATPAAELVTLIAAGGVESVPALRDLLVAMLTAALDPPADTAPPGAFLIARADALLHLGALTEAEALLTAAGPPDAEALRRQFDIALLRGTEDAACAALRASPHLAPALPARLFCLARGGDWATAALALEAGRALGALAPDEAALMARFLDPALDEGSEPLVPPLRPSPLTLRIHEAVGEPLLTTGLPIAFAHADLRATQGWKVRIDAAERLARAGALPGAALAALYAERRPAASGGVWDRASAVQALDAALAAGDAAAAASALPAAWAAMAAAELEMPFAAAFAGALAALPPDGPAGELAFRIRLLGPDPAAVSPPPGVAAAFLSGLARGDIAGTTAPDSLGRAIAPVFGPAAPPPPEALARLIAEDRRGEAALRAMARIADGATGDRRGLAEGLATLRALGLDGPARRAALQLMLLDRRG